jgi:MoxR-like ATPase
MCGMAADASIPGDEVARLRALRDALNGVLFGQEELVEAVLTGLLAGGHILLEGLPGLGKTALVKGLARALDLDSSRIQFTPDLLPGDITGNPILQEIDGTRRFVFERGPLFASIVLADEINRASPKTQSALLEAMQEHRVTVMGESHNLPDPFFVLATQNPIELEGTYPLPEAQLDRFLFKLEVRRVGPEVLQKIIRERPLGVEAGVEVVMTREEFSALRNLVARVHLPEPVISYIARLVDATHEGPAAAGVQYGASPRAAIGLAAAARASALCDGRMHAGFEDVEKSVRAVLGHRLVIAYQARIEGLDAAGAVERILESVPKTEHVRADVFKAARV